MHSINLMHIKHMTKKKRQVKGQLREETWFMYWLEKQVTLMKRSQDKEKARKEILEKIKTVEQMTGQKL